MVEDFLTPVNPVHAVPHEVVVHSESLVGDIFRISGIASLPKTQSSTGWSHQHSMLINYLQQFNSRKIVCRAKLLLKFSAKSVDIARTRHT